MKLYSLKGIYETYGISVPMLKKLISNKQITVTKVGNKNFILDDTIHEYINKNTKEATNV